jgi:tRNA(Ile2) C34 agmatinyltransferase TiaS
MNEDVLAVAHIRTDPALVTRPLETCCPACEAWADSAGITDTWTCPSCHVDLPETVQMRGGLLDQLEIAVRAALLTPAGTG